MTSRLEVICVGSVLWDMIGHAASHMKQGADVPGRITRLPGGVAMNIAMALNGIGLSTGLLSAVGKDKDGQELMRAAADLGLITDYVYLSDDLPTDRYMAIEGANGLIAAIADAHSLEAAGDKILRPLYDGRLGNDEAPFAGSIVLDGNLTMSLLHQISQSPAFNAADFRVAPASPGKAERLNALIGHRKATFYVNLEEANILSGHSHNNTSDAATALLARGAERVLVTNGGKAACFAQADEIITLTPPEVMVTRVTGAGDMFMAAHIAAELKGLSATPALSAALDAAAAYISYERPL